MNLQYNSFITYNEHASHLLVGKTATSVEVEHNPECAATVLRRESGTDGYDPRDETAPNTRALQKSANPLEVGKQRGLRGRHDEALRSLDTLPAPS